MSLGTSPSCPHHPLCERTLVHLGSHLVELTLKTHLQPPACALLWRVSQCSLLLGGLACPSSDHPGPCAHMAIAVTCYHISNLKKLLCFFLISIFPALRPTALASSSGLCHFESFVLLTVVCLCCSLWTQNSHLAALLHLVGPLRSQGGGNTLKLPAIVRISFLISYHNEVSGTLFINIWGLINCWLSYSFINQLVLVCFYS